MENKLPDTLKERIEQEARTIRQESEFNLAPYGNGFETGYLTASSKILGNPGAYGLAGAEWTSVENGLPPKFKNVLGLSKFGKVAITCVDSAGELDQFELEVDRDDCWTHWTYLPPKPGESAPPVEKVGELVKALKIIAEWKLPETGQFWDDDKERPMSYGACYGSNGERDYMKMIASNALKQYKQ
jgi:hypothetical protein